MAASLAGLCLLLAGAAAPAQELAPAAWTTSTANSGNVTLHAAQPAPAPSGPEELAVFHKSPEPILDGPALTPPPAPAALPAPAVPGLLALQRPEAPRGRRMGEQGYQNQETTEYQIQLEPPGPERLFRLESEAELQERMRQEARGRDISERIYFPEEPILSREPYRGRNLPPSLARVDPHYVCYQKLLFEQINAERYDWDLGFIHPIVSAGLFYFDVATLPYHLFTRPCQGECSAGYCLPGDPVPMLLYPPELSLTGTIAEAGTVVALFAIFP